MMPRPRQYRDVQKTPRDRLETETFETEITTLGICKFYYVENNVPCHLRSSFLSRNEGTLVKASRGLSAMSHS